MTDEREINAGLTERAHHAGDGKPAAPRQRRMPAKKNGRPCCGSCAARGDRARWGRICRTRTGAAIRRS